MAGDAPYYTADQLIEEARRQHRMLSEPADDDARQLYTGSCTGCEWTTRGTLEAHMLQDAFDAHMTALQDEAHRPPPPPTRSRVISRICAVAWWMATTPTM